MSISVLDWKYMHLDDMTINLKADKSHDRKKISIEHRLKQE